MTSKARGCITVLYPNTPGVTQGSLCQGKFWLEVPQKAWLFWAPAPPPYQGHELRP